MERTPSNILSELQRSLDGFLKIMKYYVKKVFFKTCFYFRFKHKILLCLKCIHRRIFLFFARHLKQNCWNVFVFLRRAEQSFRFSLETDNWRMKLTFLIFYLANKFQQAKPQGAESILTFYSNRIKIYSILYIKYFLLRHIHKYK